MKAPCLHFLLSVCIKASLAAVCFKETFHNANLWKVPNSHMPTSLSLSLSLSSTNTPSTIIWHGKTYYSSSTVTADRRSVLKTARAENTHSQPNLETNLTAHNHRQVFRIKWTLGKGITIHSTIQDIHVCLSQSSRPCQTAFSV